MTITPQDLQDPTLNSGFLHVVPAGGKGSGHGGGKPWKARTRPAPGQRWSGPRRATALEAAQDYCNYVNGLGVAALPSYAAPVIDMGGTTKHAPKAEKVQVIRPDFKGKHDVYDVLFYDPETGTTMRRKVGVTARGHSRYADICKTFGWCIKPLNTAVTYPSKAAAKQAEAAKIAEVCKDPNWKRVAKECFAPITPAVRV